MINRFRSALNYLGMMDPIWKWRLSRGDCPNCGKSLFLIMIQKRKGTHQILNPGAFGSRCLSCKGNGTGLGLAKAVQDLPWEGKEFKSWEMSTYGSTLDQLYKKGFSVTTSEFINGVQSGKTINGTLVQDAQHTSFNDETFDLITSNQVFEHIPEFNAVINECHRILKASGILMFAVPLYETSRTQRNAYIDSGNLIFLGTPEYHDSRIEGPGCTPVFWRFSINDITKIIDPNLFESEVVWSELGKGIPKAPFLFCKKL